MFATSVLLGETSTSGWHQDQEAAHLRGAVGTMLALALDMYYDDDFALSTGGGGGGGKNGKKGGKGRATKQEKALNSSRPSVYSSKHVRKAKNGQEKR